MISEADSTNKRIIQVNEGIIGPVEPRLISVKSKQIGDFKGVPAVYHEVAKNYSNKFLAGPPLCDEFFGLIQHMFTEEEASVIRHLRPLRAKSAKALAKAEHRPVEEVKTILEWLANEKGVLVSFGLNLHKLYSILPLAPGTFEMVMMRTSEDTLTAWHRRFAELFGDLYGTGYLADITKDFPHPWFRIVPIKKSIEKHPMALPSDRLEEVIDPYKKFGVGLCACRLSKENEGKSCKKPLEVCTAFGGMAEFFISRGKMRRVEKNEFLEIKAEAEANGLVTWLLDVGERPKIPSKIGNFSCSCCGCCCDAFRTISEFNMPGLLAPAHFLPEFDHGNCNYCGNCATKCPMGAITVDTRGKTHAHQLKRCIGCGQCVLACDKKRAILMEPAQGYKKPTQYYPVYGYKFFSGLIRNAWRDWREG